MSLWKKFTDGFKSASVAEPSQQSTSPTHGESVIAKKEGENSTSNGLDNYRKGLNYFKVSSDGRSQDLTKAMQYFSKASDQNYPMANMYLAIMYLCGIGFNIDRAKGLTYLKKAEALNVDESYMYLADYYKEISFKLSLKYFEKYFETMLFEKDGNTELINQNNYYSKIESIKKYCDLLTEKNKSIDIDIINLHRNELLESYQNDYNFYLESASEDYEYLTEKKHCMNIIKNISQQNNENNFIVKQNKDDDFLDNLTLSNNEKPWCDDFETAENYYYGLNDEIQDYKEALKYYKKAADLGSDEALMQLGIMYKDSEGCNKNNEKALDYFKAGAKSGNLNCYAEMAKLFIETNNTQNASKCWDKFFLSDNNNDRRNIAINAIPYMQLIHYFGVEYKYKCKLLPYKNEIIKHLEGIKENLLRNGERDHADTINFYYNYLN